MGGRKSHLPRQGPVEEADRGRFASLGRVVLKCILDMVHLPEVRCSRLSYGPLWPLLVPVLRLYGALMDTLWTPYGHCMDLLDLLWTSSGPPMAPLRTPLDCMDQSGVPRRASLSLCSRISGAPSTRRPA